MVKRIKRVQLFIFLRQMHHELFDEAFQAELATVYDDTVDMLKERFHDRILQEAKPL